jgi:outer membrane protein assembly factor BamB
MWQARVGAGFSSMAIQGNRLVTLGNSADRDTVFCLDTGTGAVLWTHSYACDLDPNLYEGGPNATPAIVGERVFTLSKDGHVFCFELATGHVVWSQRLQTDLGIQRPTWGFASSPLVEGGRVFLNAGSAGLALDAGTGAMVWQSDTAHAGYSSVVPFDTAEGRAGVMMSYVEVVAVALEDGRVLWRVPWREGARTNNTDPLELGDYFFVTSYGKTGRLVAKQTGGVRSDWGTSQMRTHLSPGVVYDGHLYGFNNRADSSSQQFNCVRLSDGQATWSAAMRVGAVLGAGDRLIVQSGSGKLLLVEADPAELRVVSEYAVFPGKSWTLPALVGDRLYARSAAGEVVSLKLPMASPGAPVLELRREADAVVLSWPVGASGFKLEGATEPAGPWLSEPGLPVPDAAKIRVTLPATEDARFFRLTQSPP